MFFKIKNKTKDFLDTVFVFLEIKKMERSIKKREKKLFNQYKAEIEKDLSGIDKCLGKRIKSETIMR